MKLFDLTHRRELGELRRDERAAERAEQAAIRTARALASREERAERATQRAARREALAALGRRLRPVVPLLIVNSAAVYGQVSYGFTHYSPNDWPILARLLVAVVVATGVESIALNVQWHAHDALMNKATAPAARLRRASYLIAGAVAGVNYLHFSNNGSPTAAAIVFALFSASSPWLWGMHTRRQHHLQLKREGRADSVGAVFSAERWRAFPVRTLKARRWSIDHGIEDPRAAWEGYRRATTTVLPPEQQLALLVALTRIAAPAVPKPRPRRDVVPAALMSTPAEPVEQPPPRRVTADGDRAAELIAAGYGRERLAEELDISEHQARKMLKEAKQA